ncbi:GIY-YIG nuclease family protein [Micrococcus sp. KRD128]|uniref:GIY-YIG nuclease family protein n=1 Tax=Micrococcus sp. KRD128 TaxID=2729722 RepID=UPI0019D03311|nr:GIY-YIG nuclease family protein [Micrococcus sp. KRD128]
MAHPKTLQVFLMDGSPTGRLKCTLDNWTGLVYVVPRTSLNVRPRPEAFESTGVYLLLGQDADSGEDAVYVGQAVGRANGNGLVGRIQEHVANGRHDFWNRAILLTTLGDSFGPTEVTFLENLFFELAKATGRYRVDNASTPPEGNVTEEKRAELHEYADKGQLVISALGHRVFEEVDDQRDPSSAPQPGQKPDDAVYSMSINDGNATGRPTSEGFVIFAGSRVAKDLRDSAPAGVRANREKHQAVLTMDGVLTADALFSSSSAAASFIAGGSMSGPRSWIAPDGRTLGVHEAAAAEAGDLADGVASV